MKKNYIQPQTIAYRFISEGAMLLGSDTKLNINNSETMDAADAYSNKANNGPWGGNNGGLWSNKD